VSELDELKKLIFKAKMDTRKAIKSRVAVAKQVRESYMSETDEMHQLIGWRDCIDWLEREAADVRKQQ
jgi:hypothetical protein